MRTPSPPAAGGCFACFRPKAKTQGQSQLDATTKGVQALITSAPVSPHVEEILSPFSASAGIVDPTEHGCSLDGVCGVGLPDEQRRKAAFEGLADATAVPGGVQHVAGPAAGELGADGTAGVEVKLAPGLATYGSLEVPSTWGSDAASVLGGAYDATAAQDGGLAQIAETDEPVSTATSPAATATTAAAAKLAATNASDSAHDMQASAAVAAPVTVVVVPTVMAVTAAVDGKAGSGPVTANGVATNLEVDVAPVATLLLPSAADVDAEVTGSPSIRLRQSTPHPRRSSSGGECHLSSSSNNNSMDRAEEDCVHSGMHVRRGRRGAAGTPDDEDTLGPVGGAAGSPRPATPHPHKSLPIEWETDNAPPEAESQGRRKQPGKRVSFSEASPAPPSGEHATATAAAAGAERASHSHSHGHGHGHGAHVTFGENQVRELKHSSSSMSRGSRNMRISFDDQALATEHQHDEFTPHKTQRDPTPHPRKSDAHALVAGDSNGSSTATSRATSLKVAVSGPLDEDHPAPASNGHLGRLQAQQPQQPGSPHPHKYDGTGGVHHSRERSGGEPRAHVVSWDAPGHDNGGDGHPAVNSGSPRGTPRSQAHPHSADGALEGGAAKARAHRSPTPFNRPRGHSAEGLGLGDSRGSSPSHSHSTSNSHNNSRGNSRGSSRSASRRPSLRQHGGGGGGDASPPTGLSRGASETSSGGTMHSALSIVRCASEAFSASSVHFDDRVESMDGGVETLSSRENSHTNQGRSGTPFNRGGGDPASRSRSGRVSWDDSVTVVYEASASIAHLHTDDDGGENADGESFKRARSSSVSFDAAVTVYETGRVSPHKLDEVASHNVAWDQISSCSSSRASSAGSKTRGRVAIDTANARHHEEDSPHSGGHSSSERSVTHSPRSATPHPRKSDSDGSSKARPAWEDEADEDADAGAGAATAAVVSPPSPPPRVTTPPAAAGSSVPGSPSCKSPGGSSKPVPRSPGGSNKNMREAVMFSDDIELTGHKNLSAMTAALKPAGPVAAQAVHASAPANVTVAWPAFAAPNSPVSPGHTSAAASWDAADPRAPVHASKHGSPVLHISATPVSPSTVVRSPFGAGLNRQGSGAAAAAAATAFSKFPARTPSQRANVRGSMDSAMAGAIAAMTAAQQQRQQQRRSTSDNPAPATVTSASWGVAQPSVAVVPTTAAQPAPQAFSFFNVALQQPIAPAAPVLVLQPDLSSALAPPPPPASSEQPQQAAMPQPQAQLPRPPSQQQLQPEEECNSSSSFAMFSSPSIDQGASHLSNPSSNHEPQDLNAGGSGSLSRGHSPGVVPRPDSGDSGSGSGSGTPPLRRKGKGRKIRRFSEMTNFDFEGEPPLHNPWTFKRSDAPERHMQRLSVDLLFGPKPGDDKQMTRSEAKESIQRLIRHASSTGAYGESHMALAAAAAVVAADGDKASPSAAGPPLRHTVSLDPNAVRAYAIMSDSGDEA